MSRAGPPITMPRYWLKVCLTVSLRTSPHSVAIGVLNCIRAIGGYTDASSVDTVFNTDNFVEIDYQERITKHSASGRLILSWRALSFISYTIVYFAVAGMMHLKLLPYIVRVSLMWLLNLASHYTILVYATLSNRDPLHGHAYTN